MKRLILLAVIILTICPGIVNSQQIPLYSQYKMNKYLVNPAYAGSQGYTSYNLTARQQWMGFGNVNPPSTQAFSIQKRILKTSYLDKMRFINKSLVRKRPSDKVGIGGYIFNDRNGIMSRTGIQGTYAYHIFLDEAQLSFGISGNVYQFKIDDENLTFPNLELGIPEPLLMNKMNTIFIPDANAGIYYMYRDFYAGFSVMSLFESMIKLGKDHSYGNYQLLRHYYFMSGYKFKLNEDYALEPSALFKSTEKLNLQADLNLRMYYQNDYWMGLAYRTGKALITSVGIKIRKLYLGYAYDYSLRDIQNVTYGSHEIMIGVIIGDSRRRFRWLERY